MTLEKLYELIPQLKEDNYTTLEDVLDYLSCASLKQKHLEDESRWWNIYSYIVEAAPGVFIKYYSAETTGDRTPTEVGFEQEDYGFNTMKQVFPKTVTTTIYE